jgi:hypothetical protein
VQTTLQDLLKSGWKELDASEQNFVTFRLLTGYISSQFYLYGVGAGGDVELIAAIGVTLERQENGAILD